MRRKRMEKVLALLVLIFMSLSTVPINGFAKGSFPTRLAGNTAAETAVAIADQTGWGETAILASSEIYGMVDALTSGPLATVLKAPILLQEAGEVLNSYTKAELIKLKVKTVYVTSGTAVIRQKVLDELKSMGITVVSLGGIDRYDTSAKIAQKIVSLVTVNKVAVASGLKSQDALSIASIASAANQPILLTDGYNLPESVREFLAANPSITSSNIIGGTGVISDQVMLRFPNPTRHAGNTAYDTNTQVIQDFDSSIKYDHLYIANGETVIDALAGVPLAAQSNAAIVITNQTVPRISTFVNRKLTTDSVVTALGGLAVVPETVLAGLRVETEPAPEPVLRLNKTSLTLNKGETILLTVNLTDQDLSWSSSDSSIAKVDNSGKVTAVSKGTATITVTKKDGSKTAGAQCVVTVKEQSSSSGSDHDDDDSEEPNTPPILSINEQSGDVLTPLFKVTGTAQDTHGLAKVSYSVTNASNPDEAYVDVFVKPINAPNEVKSFVINIENILLVNGINQLKIKATDTDGLQVEKLITLNYKAPSLKPIEEAKIETDALTGLKYINDQIIITGKDDVTEEQIALLVQPYHGIIVGRIPITNDYQVEIPGPVTKNQLETIISELKLSALVEAASLNTVSETPIDIVFNDSHWSGEVWSETEPEGRNWGVEAIKAPTAWEHNFEMQRINIGLIDSMFDTSHEDLDFAGVFDNPTDIYQPSYEKIFEHGTHVAGTIAATSDNNLGITGLVGSKNLYGFSIMGDTTPTMQNMSSSMQWKYALAELIIRNVKVINVSMGMNKIAQVAALNNNEAVLEALDYEAEQNTIFLKKLLNKGFDFVIVQAAGNTSHTEYVADPEAVLGYRLPGLLDFDRENTNWLDARFNGLFTRITDEQVKDRIIVVGAIKNLGYSNNWFGLSERRFNGYAISNFSQVGDRVDVVAPGENISSTIPNNGYADDWAGTSMAAPHVTGVAGMVWAINPELTGEQVKRIIVETADRPITLNSRNYPLLNAQTAVERARSERADESPDPVDTGILMGTVTDANGGGNISNAQISVYKEYGQEGAATTEYTAATVTDNNGEFELILPGGQYNLNVLAPGYLPFQMTVDVLNNHTTYAQTILTIADEGDPDLTGTAGGLIRDAFTGSVIPDAGLKFRPGWNSTSGEYVQNDSEDVVILTNAAGYYEVNLGVGNYTVEASKDGYVTGYFNIIVLAADPDIHQHGVITPVLPEGQTRIVLTWGQTPSDLDSHLTGPILNSEERFHVFYSSSSYYESDIKYCDLDVDDTSSFGPETTTIYEQIPGVYRFSIHDFSNRHSSASNAMSLSGAQVKVYRGNTLLATYNVPTNQIGTVWTVFEINGDDIIPINTMRNESNPDLVSRARFNPADSESPDTQSEDLNLFNDLPEKKDGN